MRARASVRVSSFTRVRTFALCDFSSLNHDTKEQPQKLTKAYSPPLHLTYPRWKNNKKGHQAKKLLGRVCTQPSKQEPFGYFRKLQWSRAVAGLGINTCALFTQR